MISKILVALLCMFGAGCEHEQPVSKQPVIIKQPDLKPGGRKYRLVQAVQDKEITWWRTNDATVIGNQNNCSLFLNRKPSVIFIWKKEHQVIGLEDTSFNFPDTPEFTLIAIKFDDKWMQSETPTILASGMRNVVTVSFTKQAMNLNDVLMHTSHITISSKEVDLHADIRHPKMSQLLDAVNKCRQLLR